MFNASSQTAEVVVKRAQAMFARRWGKVLNDVHRLSHSIPMTACEEQVLSLNITVQRRTLKPADN